MRAAILAILLMLLGGCAMHGQRAAVAQRPRGVEGGSAALAFDPPAAATGALDLWRDERQPAVFLGYREDVTYTYTRTSDWLIDLSGSDLLIRHTLTEKQGVSYR